MGKSKEMRLALIADIHSNLQALRAVIAHIDDVGADAIYCIGDVVGYGADPLACLELVRERCAGTVLGNHDLAVATGEGRATLPADGQEASDHNRSALSGGDQESLAALPLILETDGCTFVHASPSEPSRWLRIESFHFAQAQFEHFQTDICFTGHTHLPGILSNQLGVLRVRPGYRYIVNVGSVGQPRDGDPRACVGFFNTDDFTYELARIPYNADVAGARIIDEGLPRRLARRLQQGL